MAVRITETWNSRDLGLELGGADAMAEFAITGTTNELEAYAACLAEVPPRFHDLSFKSLKLKPLGGPNWVATVTYGISTTGQQVPSQAGPPGSQPPPPPPPAETDALTDEDGVSFSTRGGTVKVFTSLNTVHRISLNDEPPPDFEGKIGAKGEGCEVFDGKLQFTLKRNFPAVSMRYVKTLADLTGLVNEGTWRYFGDSACLFLGADGEYAGPKGWAVSFQFDVARSTPIRDPGTGEVIPNVTLPPHHYAWTLAEKRESQGKPVEVPVAIYVEQVYEKGDFDQLGI